MFLGGNRCFGYRKDFRMSPRFRMRSKLRRMNFEALEPVLRDTATRADLDDLAEIVNRLREHAPESRSPIRE